MSSTAGNETAKDSMDEIKADPEQRSQGTSPPSLLGSYFEAGDEDKGEPLGSTQAGSSNEGPHPRTESFLKTGSVRGEGVPLEREPPTRVRSNAESVVRERV